MTADRIGREFPGMRAPAAAILPARAFGWIALGVAIFTIYGSLVPFTYRWRPFDEALNSFRWVIEHRSDIQSRSDFLANFVLALPLGFGLAAFALLDRNPNAFRRTATALFLWPCCALFAALVEFSQLYFPDRTSSGSDIIAQSLGSACGIVAYMYLGQRSVDRVRAQFGADPYRSPAVGWLAFGVAALALAQWLPLDITASPADWYRKLRDGRATLVPFTELAAHPDLAAWHKAQVWLELAAQYFPIGLILAFVSFATPVPIEGTPAKLPTVRAALRTLGFGFLLAAILEAGQFAIASRSPSTSDILIGGGSVFLVLLFARGMGVNATGGGLDIEAALILGQAWLLWLAVAAWLPFEFDGSIGGARFDRLNWIPFAAAQEKNYLGSLEEAIARILHALPFGAIVAAVGAPGAMNRRGRIAIGAALAAGSALLLEAGQIFVAERFASPSDVLYAAIGGGIGAVATLRLRQGDPAARESVALTTTPPPVAMLQVDDPRRVIK